MRAGHGGWISFPDAGAPPSMPHVLNLHQELVWTSLGLPGMLRKPNGSFVV